MSVKCHKIELNYLAQEPTFRSDINYLTNDIHVSKNDYYRFEELFEIECNDGVIIETLDSFEYAEISNVTSTGEVFPVKLNMDDKNDLNANYFNKIEKGDIINVKQNDILISKVRPYLKKIVFIDDSNCHIFYTSAFIHLHPKKNPRILYYLLRYYFIDYINSIARQGKGYPTLSERDLRYMKFQKDVVDSVLDEAHRVLSQITTFEKKIKKLQNKKIPLNTIIDSVFEKEYKISEAQIIADYSPIYTCELKELSPSYDFRSSFRYNSHKYNYLYSAIFQEHTLDEVIDIDATSLGRQISPTDIIEDSDVYYINTNSIKTSGFDESVLSPITESFYNINKKIKVEKNDILLIASGEGSIGKAALFDSDKKCITSQFVMKLHPKDGVNIDYVLFYIQSFLFQNTIEKNKKGKGNMTNIFASQLKDFPILLPTKEKQKQIVKQIKEMKGKQHRFDCEIELLRKEISKTVKSVIQEGGADNP